MAANCNYEEQLKETCRLVAEAAGVGPDRWSLAYQSRSGRPTDPWLGPDILEHLEALKDRGVRDVVVQPVGFLSDHMEVMFDLDEEAHAPGRRAGPDHGPRRDGRHRPEFVGDAPRADPRADRPAPSAGPSASIPASHDVCPVNCCLPPPRPAPAGGLTVPIAMTAGVYSGSARSVHPSTDSEVPAMMPKLLAVGSWSPRPLDGVRRPRKGAGDAPVPKPELTPEQVVEIQVEALRKNDVPTPDAGIATTFRFASPGNRKVTGPLERFAPIVKAPATAR